MDAVEATSAQHAVWFTEQAGVAGTAYHMAVAVRFGAGLDRRALTAACATVVARHPSLAARVVVDDGGLPRLAPAARPPELLAAATAPGPDRPDPSGDPSAEQVAEQVGRRYELREGPLARFTLLTDAAGRDVLLVTAHHLVFDGMSKDVLLADLAAAYAAARAGRPAPTPQRYPDHAATERDRIAEELPTARTHWARHWAAPGSPVLPGLLRTPTGAEPGATVPVELDPHAAAAIGPAAQTVGVTRFEFLLAAVHALLDRYGNTGLPVGVGLSTRTAATAGLIGLFVNELPVGVAPGTGTFGEYALALRARLRELYRIRTVPLAHAVTGLRPAPALTPVSVGYRRRGPEPVFEGVDSTVDWTVFCGAARNALHIQIVDGPAGPAISLAYSPTAITADAVARIGAHLRTLLTAAVADPDRRVADLPVLPAAELDQVLRAGQGPVRAYPRDATVPALFAARVAAAPDAVAVVDGDRTLCYADVEAASARLAALLRARGVGPGSLVAVALDRSWQAVAALLAVLRTGAGYVPIDPGHPPARRALVLADARPALVVTTGDRAAELGPGLPVLAVDHLESGATGASPDGGPGPGPDEVAYVLYTSGSTGRPKGVGVRHGALANLLLAMGELLDSRPEHRWLNLTSPSFDISGLEIFLPLVTGGRVVVAAGISGLDGAAVLRLIRTAGVTHAQATPSGWRVLLAAGLGAASTDAAGLGTASPDAAGLGTASPEPLVAIAGGEVLPVPLARDLRARVTRLVNGYGPTEATIYATTEDVGPEPDEVSIGQPLPNTRAYVLDGDLRPAPIGVPGDLYLGGAGLAAGYHGDPELTAAAFVTGPFDGERLYRTGDRCRWLPDGRLDFLGRTDDQVKIRGHRIEPGEITARLLEHPELAEAIVLPRLATAVTTGVTQVDAAQDDAAQDDPANDDAVQDDEPAPHRLVAYLVARGPARPEPADLRRYLADRLPAAMVPTDWVFLDRLPQGPNGKVDRAALPDPGPTPRADPVPDDPADADPLIAQLRVIWQDVLKIPDVGPHEDLFDLGGHSLTITRISGRIQQRFGVEVPLDVFFDMPTIAEIAEVVRATGGAR